MSIKITCINKDNGYHSNPHEAVADYGWVEDGTGKSGKTDRQTMVSWVKSGVVAYVEDNYRTRAFCYVNKSINGTEFLETRRDGRVTNNLLSLPECS